MNELIKQIIREIFLYKDMQDYLCENIALLDKIDIVNIIRRSFLPLSRKLEMFEALAVYEDKDALEAELAEARKSMHRFDAEWIQEHSYSYQALFLKEALSQLTTSAKSSGVLLMIEYQQVAGMEQRVGELPFYTYDKLIRFIKDSIAEETLEYMHARRRWYLIEKYIENTDGDLVETYSYYVFDGEVIYCDCEDSPMGNHYGDLNVPVPFHPGDIIRCDGGPTCDEVTAVILRTGDNRDCCSLVALCKRENGMLEAEPVKHSCMFYTADTKIYIPPLYTARCINNELGNENIALKHISKFVNGDEDRGYIVERNVPITLQMEEVTDEWIRELEDEYQKWN